MRAAVVWAIALALASGSARAQSIGQAVGNHVNDNLGDKPKPKPKPKPHPKPKPPPGPHPPPPPPRPPPPGPPRPGPPATTPMPAEPPAPPKPAAEELPYRIFGKSFELDPMTSLAYRGWRPQAFPDVDVATANAATWSVGARLRLYWVSVEQAHYESNGVGSPRHSGASIAARAGSATPVAAWFVGALGFPFDWVLEPIIRYETRAFESTLTPRTPVRIIPFSASQNDNLSTFPTTTGQLTLTSSFETLVVALKYHHDNDPTGIISAKNSDFPSIYFGLGLTQYSKPYMVRVGNAVLGGLIFNARMRGAGLALGVSTAQKPEHFFVDFSSQLGLGEVQLTQDFTLNSTLPSGWHIGYGQADLTAGYLHPLLRTRPTLLGGLSGSVGGATFFYFKPFTTNSDNVQTPAVNWDLLWGLRAFIVVPL